MLSMLSIYNHTPISVFLKPAHRLIKVHTYTQLHTYTNHLLYIIPLLFYISFIKNNTTLTNYLITIHTTQSTNTLTLHNINNNCTIYSVIKVYSQNAYNILLLINLSLHYLNCQCLKYSSLYLSFLVQVSCYYGYYFIWLRYSVIVISYVMLIYTDLRTSSSVSTIKIYFYNNG